MSANVDQRSKGQPNQVSNGPSKDVIKEDNPYLPPPVHSMRSWSEQTSDSPYGAPPMSNAGVSDSFFQNYYASNMTYPFMNQGLGASEGPWSNGADTMFGMGYDYSSMYGGFGFPPFNNWEYASEYWGSSQPQRKDQRAGYPPHQDDPYYHPPEMIPADTYGMMTNGVAPGPPEPQEPIGTVEQGLRGMSIGSGGHMPSASSMPDPSSSRKKAMDLNHQPPPSMGDNFGNSGHHHADPSHMMMQHPPPMTHQQPPQSQSNSSMMSVGSSSNVAQASGSSGGHSQPKKTSWAAIASQPARTQQQLRPRTIPRAPVNPNKPHSGNMDIGTWDNRGGNVSSKLPAQALPPPPTVSQAPPPPRVQNWAASSAPPPRAARQVGPPPSSNSPPGSGASINSNMNNSSSSETGNTNSGAPGSSPSVHPSSGFSNYGSGSGGNSGPSGGGAAGNTSNSSSNQNSSATVNGSHVPSGNGRDSQQMAGGANISATAPPPVLDQLKFNNYNPKEFNLNPKSARFFIIKSYSEDDIHRSIKYNIWCSTEHGNKRLDAAFREREGKGPVYLIYSVNGSGHFCGIAQMMSPVDYNKSAGVWAQDKWKGQFTVKWVYVKDVPNSQLRHIRLENNENKPVTNSRDTQEVPAEKGKQVLRILHAYKHFTSIFDDFVHYEKRQQEDAANSAAAPPQHHGHQHRGNNNGDHRGDGRDHRDHRERGDGMGGRNRDNRRGGGGGYDMGGRGGHDHRDGGRGHDQRGGGYHESGGRGGRH